MPGALTTIDRVGVNGLVRFTSLRTANSPGEPYSARIQTVRAETNPLYHALLERFHALTGCAVLVNTSFNVRGEPIVCTPRDAYICFMRTEMDALVLGSFFLDKAQQPPLREDVDWRSLYQLD